LDKTVDPIIDKATAKTALALLAPQMRDLIVLLRDSGGRIAFRDEFTDLVERLKITAYTKLYEMPDGAQGVTLMVAVLGEEGAKEWEQELRALTAEGRGAEFLELGPMMESLADSIDLDATPEAKSAAAAAFEALAESERHAAVHFWQQFMMAAIAMLFQHLSLIVHGQKLTTLVAKAKTGDDGAFLKAVQIDKRILTELEYFKSRYARADLSGDRAFVTAVARKLEAPPYIGRTSHRKLWVALYLLDACRLLHAYKARELLDMLQEAGIVDDDEPIDDETAMNKLRARYVAHIQMLK
jgi:hypothetical protein